MSEEVFSGDINLNANFGEAEEAVSGFLNKIKEFASSTRNALSSVGGKAALAGITGGLDSLAQTLDHAVLEVDKFDTTVTSFATGVERLMEPPKQSFSELLGLIRVGVRQIGDENGDLVQGVGLLSGALEKTITQHIPGLRGVGKAFGWISENVSRASPYIKSFQYLVSGTDRTTISLISASRKLAVALQTQKIAWAAVHQEQTQTMKEAHKAIAQLTKAYQEQNALLELQKMLTKQLEGRLDVHQIETLRDRLKEAGFGAESFGESMVKIAGAVEKSENRIRGLQTSMGQMSEAAQATFEEAGIDNYNMDVKEAAVNVAVLKDAEEELGDRIKVRTHLQKALMTLTNSSYTTLGNMTNYISATLKAGGKLSAKYLGRAQEALDAIALRMQAFTDLGGEVPKELEESFGRMSEIIKAASLEVKRTNKGMARSGKEFADSADQRTSRFKRWGKTVKETSEKIKEHTKTVEQANRANYQLIQAVQPQGMLNLGFNSLTEVTKTADQSINTMSLSLGSVVGIAGAVGGALGQIHPAFSAIIVGAAQLGSQFLKSFTAIANVSGTAAQKVQAAMNIISNSLLGFGMTATATIIKTGLLAAEVKTLEITMTQIARNLAREAGGDMDLFAAKVSEMRNELVEAGITTRESTKAMSQFLRARLPIERVGDLANAAKNLGVTVANMSSSEVFGRFIQFIQTGNSALLDAIGVAKNASIMYEEFGKEIGKTGKTLTTYEKQQALINGIIKETTTVQGVYNEAQKTAGKQLSSMKRLFEEAMLVIGRRFEPTLAKLIITMNNLLKWFNELPPSMHDNIAGVIKWAATVGTLIAAVIALLPALKAIIPVVKALGGTLIKSMPWLLAISAAITAIIFVVKGVKKAFDENFGGIRDAIMRSYHAIKNVLEPVIQSTVGWIKQLRADFENLIRTGSEIVTTFVGRFAATIDQIRYKIIGVVTDVKAILTGAFWALHHVIRGITALMSGDTEEAMAHFEEAIVSALSSIHIFVRKWVVTTWQKMLEDIKITVNSWIDDATMWGRNLATNFANGIVQGAGRTIVKVMSWLGNLLGAYLRPGSPPKVGPLKHIAEWGRGIMATFLGGFGLADFKVLKDAMSPIKQALKDAVSAGTIEESDMIPMLKNVRASMAELIRDFRKTGVVNEEVMQSISGQLGQGGKDIMTYVRRLMDHQKALRNLSEVQEEFAEAEKAGFVTRELKDRLTAAEKEANATKDALDWQKEYLAAQRETVDMQLQQMKILEALAKAMDKVAKSLKGLKPKKGKGVEEEFEFKLPEFDEKPLVEAALEFDEIQFDASQLSKEFLDARTAMSGFVKGFKEWAALPIGEKLALLAEKLEKITGWPIVEWWEKAIELWDKAKEAMQGFVDVEIVRWWNEIKEAFSSYLPELTEAWKEIGLAWDEVKMALADIGIEVPSTKKVLISMLKNAVLPLLVIFRLFKGIVLGVARAMTGFAKSTKNTARAIKGAAQIFRGIFELDLDKILEGFGNVFQGVKGFFGGLLDSVLGFVSGFFEGALPGMWDSIRTFFTTTIPGKITEIKDFIVGLFTKSAALVTKEAPAQAAALGGTIKTWFSAAWANIVTFFTETIPTYAGKIFEWIGNIVSQGFARLGEFLVELPGKLASLLGQMIGGALTLIFVKIPEWIATLGIMLAAVVLGGISWLITNVPIFIENLGKVISDLWKGFVAFVTVTAPKMQEDFQAKLIEIIVGAIAWLVENVPVFLESLGNWFTSVWTGFIEFLTTGLPEFISSVSTWFNSVWTGFTTWITTEAPGLAKNWLVSFSKVYNNFMEKLGEKAKEWMEMIWTWFKEDIMKPFLQGIIDNGPEWAKDFIELGEALMAGLKQGIKDKVSDIADAVLESIRSTIAAAKKMMGVESPSKVMAEELGKPMIEGLVAGIEKYAHLPEDALRGIMDGVIKSGNLDLNMPGGMQQVSQNRTSYFQYGAFSGAFPNVQDGNSAQDFIAGLDERVSRGRAFSFVGG